MQQQKNNITTSQCTTLRVVGPWPTFKLARYFISISDATDDMRKILRRVAIETAVFAVKKGLFLNWKFLFHNQLGRSS